MRENTVKWTIINYASLHCFFMILGRKCPWKIIEVNAILMLTTSIHFIFVIMQSNCLYAKYMSRHKNLERRNLILLPLFISQINYIFCVELSYYYFLASLIREAFYRRCLQEIIPEASLQAESSFSLKARNSETSQETSLIR